MGFAMGGVSEEELRSWVAATTGGAVRDWRRLVSGNSRATFLAEVDAGGEELSLVVRHDEGAGPVAGTELSLEREAVVYGALQGKGLPVPRLYGRSVPLRAIAMTRMPGSTEDASGALPDLLGRLAQLHSLELGELELPGFARSARAELDLWSSIASVKVKRPDEVVELAFELLAELFPGEPPSPVLCHGDAGEGNFLAQDGRVTGLLDWEFSHVGDPHDDLAWITVRSLMYGHELPDFAALVREYYGPASGVPLSPERFRYWQAVVVLRNLICCLSAVQDPDPAGDRTVHLMLIPGLRARLMRMLAGLCDVEVEPPELLPEPAELPGSALLGEVVAALGEVGRGTIEPALGLRARRARRLLQHFARTWSVAPEVARVNAAERVPPDGDRVARLRYLTRAAERELALTPRLSPLAQTELAGL